MPDITISEGGESFSAYLALPQTTPAPGIVVAQEIFGVNQVMRDVCDWLASEGFIACCPDIFWRIEPGIQLTDQTDAEWKRAFELFGLFDVAKGIGDLKSTLAHLRAHPDCTGKVGSVGYCLGGKLAFLMATRSDANCNVGYYGVGLEDLLGESDAISSPLLLHIASEDDYCPKAAQEKIVSGLTGNPLAICHVYEGQDHAFARIGGAHYDADAAALANGRSLDLFREVLAT